MDEMNKVKEWYEYGGGEELLIGLCVFLLFFVLITGMVVGLSYGVDKPSCYAKTQQIGFESRWSLWGGCQILVEDGKWIPIDNYYYEQP